MEEYKSKNLPIMIAGVRVSEPNTLGGVNVTLYPMITSTKPIKYVKTTFSAYNRVGDKVKCDISGETQFTGSVTGPLNFGDFQWGWMWKNAWWNSSVHCVEIEFVSVEYMDDDVEVYLKKELDKLYAPEELRQKNSDFCDW